MKIKKTRHKKGIIYIYFFFNYKKTLEVVIRKKQINKAFRKK